MKPIQLLLSIILVCCIGCGRYLPPIPPERTAPTSVKFVSGVGDETGVTLTWRVPPTDVSSKGLKDMEEYRISRVEISSLATISDDGKDLNFDEIARIPDTHLIELKKMQDEAEEKGQIVRKVKLEDSKLTFTYKDTTVAPGITYLYKILPVNYGGEGEAKDLIRVKFNKVDTLVDTIPNRDKNINILDR